MIGSFRHKGLERLYRDDDRKWLPPQLVAQIGQILTALEAAETIEGLNRPTFRLHPLKGNRKGFWAARIGASYFASWTARRSMSILSITTSRRPAACR
jgi:proteic killer suppression protein